ncbi:MAG: hypothetical protein IIC80_10350 [Chloroflexi bacterium]|nr:hypothetical protein [Chloroflexota bacterium]MCH8283418.1 hypothetical protein [Chloroflexota bacterium]
MDRYEQLKAEAEGRGRERSAGKSRVIVQDAQCARAVGSRQVVDAAGDAVASDQPDDAAFRGSQVRRVLEGCGLPTRDNVRMIE